MGEALKVIDPWSGDVALEVPLDRPEEIEAKVARARGAAAEWRSTAVMERIALVERFLHVAVTRREELARSVSAQMGKPVKEARSEVSTMIQRARMMMALAPSGLADEHVPLGDGIERLIVREPLGVVLAIAAWNYPLLIAINAVAPAVLSGNAVLLKHASQTAGVGLWFEEAFAAAGAPPGLVGAVTVRGRDAAQLVRHRHVDAVFFTGSVPAGRQVYADVATREHGFVDAGLELGGKDPAYVRADMPLGVVVPNLVEGAFYNAGQSCCAVERIYVDRRIYADFVEAYVEESRRWTAGDPSDEATLLGPVAARDTLDTVEAQVRDAVGRGGRLLLGGKRSDGRGQVMPATVVADADQGCPLMQEESFGPVIGIAAVDWDDEAVRRMNDSAYGLTASIWTADHRRGLDLARRVSAGTVFVNRCDYVDPALPWTGFRDSGKGVTLSKLGFSYMTRPRGLHVRPLSLLSPG